MKARIKLSILTRSVIRQRVPSRDKKTPPSGVDYSCQFGIVQLIFQIVELLAHCTETLIAEGKI